MKKRPSLKLLLIAPFVFNIASSMAMNPTQQYQIAKRVSAESSNYVMRLQKTNAKGTILESTLSMYSTPDYWFNQDPENDGVEGVSSDRVYKEFAGLESNQDIIVAVIDSGVDVNHEDLQGKIWINSGEIPNNGIDDDGNGYIDDVFGWNFIGNKDGMATINADTSLENGLRLVKGDPTKQVSADTLEVTREYARLLKLKAELATIGEYLLPEEVKLLNEVQIEVESNRIKAQNQLSFYEGNLKKYLAAEKTLTAAGISTISYETINTFEPKTKEELEAKKALLALLNRGLDKESMLSEIEYYDSQANHYYNKDADSRKTIVKDNYSDATESNYGNNDVIGPDAFHGTHVSGIIAAVRDNGIGVKGIAKNVKIMAIRCVPNGDERDKDVANSIRYAVDNGAKVINMSFGKSYSPYKSVVDAAVKYAESKGVLLVHAAGNSNLNNNTAANFPNRKMMDDKAEPTNWLEIGASSFKAGTSFAASFSNYGSKSVDIFAPGVNLYSTIPDNKYSDASGTSMASPATAGVAALILSYAPEMDAKDLKDIITTTTNRYPGLKIYKSGMGQVPFTDLSIYGGTPNAYNAIKVILDVKKEMKIAK